MKNTSPHQANQVAQLKADFNTMRDELVTGFKSLTEARNADIEQDYSPPNKVSSFQGSAHATTDMNAQILQLLQQIQQQLVTLSTQQYQTPPDNNGRFTGGRGNASRGTGGRGTGNRFTGRRNVSHYLLDTWSMLPSRQSM